jgi:hypothetical protein
MKKKSFPHSASFYLAGKTS